MNSILADKFLASQLTQVVNEEFPISVVKFFKQFYSDGSFVKYYHEQRGDKDILVPDWSSHAQFGTTRELQCSLAFTLIS